MSKPLLSHLNFEDSLLIVPSSPIPEITDADMAFQAEETHSGSDIKPFWQQYRLFHAAFAQFCYTGAQVAIASYAINYFTEIRPNTSSALGAQLLAGAQGAFALGRFTGVAIMRFVKPRWVFLAYLTLCIVFVSPAITQRGNAGIAMLYLTLFFESICFPTIVALGMRGLGKYSKRGSGFIVGGVCGGAVVPPILGAVSDLRSAGACPTATAMAVPLAFFVAAWSYALAVNFVPAYVGPADRLGSAEIGLKNAAKKDEESPPAGYAETEKGARELAETRDEEIREAGRM